MPILLARIDDRMIHGQVVEGWIPHLRADMAVVVSAAAAADPTQRALMELAMPEGVELRLAPPEEAAELLLGPEAARRRVLVLAPGPDEMLALLERGVPLSAVNVGGMHYSAGRVQLGRVIYLSDHDRRALRAIAERGVTLEGRAVPSDARADIGDLLAAQEAG